MKKPITHGCAIDLDKISKLETAFKIASGNAAVEVGHILSGVIHALGAANDQHLVVNGDFKIIFTKAGNSH